MRCFIAIPCPDTIKDLLVREQKDMVCLGRIKPVEYENIHLTMKFLGEIEDSNVEKIKQVLDEINIKPFEIMVKGLGAFPNPGNPKVVWAGVRDGSAQIINLQKTMDEKLSALGFQKDNRFHPHYTIARIKKLDERQKIM